MLFLEQEVLPSLPATTLLLAMIPMLEMLRVTATLLREMMFPPVRVARPAMTQDLFPARAGKRFDLHHTRSARAQAQGHLSDAMNDA